MQHLNDDMDKLVRKAAEQYPLNTKGADWEKVFRDMNAQPAEPEEPKKAGGNKSYRHLLWLLLLLPLLWVASRYFNGSSKTNSTQTSDVKAKNEQQPTENKTELADNEARANNQKAKDAVGDAGQSKEIPDESGNGAGNGVKEKSIVTDNNQQEKNTVKTPKQKNVIAKNVLSGSNKPSINKANTQPIDKVVKNENTSSQNAVIQPQQNKNNLPPIADTKKPAQANPVVTPNATLNKNDIKTKSNDSSTASTNANKQAAQPTSVKNDDKKADIIHLKTAPQKQFYVGLLTGPDLTTVKLETMNAGYGVGAILGYRLNDHWGVETGLFWSNKNYYANGKDFNTKKLVALPSHTNILNVDGNCYMYEIPVNVNYYFGRSSGYNWFVNVGASSYLMNKEYYDYQAERYNMQWAGSWNYKNASKDWFSVLNVGAGFDQRIGKSGKLRLQPYFRIPIRGTGTGKLPITSTGFYIGYTQKLF